jgi:radical SAM-linked protein
LKAQRLRFRYRLRGDALAYGQRELVGVWEEALKAAGLSPAYSQAKRPAVQIALGAPLPLGVTSDCELVDVYLSEPVAPGEALRRLQPHLPSGIEAFAVREVGVGAPSLQSQMRWAEYEVELPLDRVDEPTVRRAIAGLLAADTVPAVYERESKVRRYDLRPLVLDMKVVGRRKDRLLLRLRLRAAQEMTGRVDQVLQTLGLPMATRVHRIRLELEEIAPAVLAYRRHGEQDEEG